MTDYAWRGRWEDSAEYEEAMARALAGTEWRRANLPKRRGKGLAVHGTTGGYQRHLRIREGVWGWPACEPCRIAKTQDQAHRRGNQWTGRHNNMGDHCGTPYGYTVHVVYRREPACFACRVAATDRRNPKVPA